MYVLYILPYIYYILNIFIIRIYVPFVKLKNSHLSINPVGIRCVIDVAWRWNLAESAVLFAAQKVRILNFRSQYHSSTNEI